MRKGFAKVVHGWHTQALEIIGRRSAKDLLLELADNAPGFQLGNQELSKRLKISDRSIKKNLEMLQGLGLIERNGKLTPQGYKRNLSITAEARRWITEGILPAHLSNQALNKICEQPVQEKFPEELRVPCNDSLKSEGLGDKPNVQEKFPEEPKFPHKKSNYLPKEKESKQSLPKKVALLALPSGEVNLELPSTEPKKQKRTDLACDALSRKQTSNHTQSERKPRGEPKKGLPEALANKIEQYQADDLWQVIDSADLTINSKIRLYEVAVRKECTPAEFKLLLDNALARNPYNLGGLLHCMLQEDVEVVRRQAFIQHDYETAQERLDALYQNGLMVADWIRQAPPQFACGSLNASKTKWIFNKTQSVTLTCSPENVLQQLNNLERTFSCTR